MIITALYYTIPNQVSSKMQKEIALLAADDAVLNIGVTESSIDNFGPAIKKYLASVNLEEGFAWCCGFVKYRFIVAAEKLDLTLSKEFLKLDGWSPSWKKYAEKHNVWTSLEDAKANPSIVKKGHVILFYSAEKKRIYHAGIVISSNESGVVTVEGNTGPGPGVTANGDGVYLKRRSWTSIGKLGGFLRTY
jgi:hypothetical protein